jgi:uncharacterized protein (TIGR02996 family)
VNHLAFLQAIRDDPDDDLPRLAYADWLEEQGDAPRGEMIRVQLELAKAPPRERALVLLRRMRELIVAHRAQWLGPLKEIAPDAVFERGFVEELSLSGTSFLRRGEVILKAHPVARLVLTQTRAVMAELAACPHLDGVWALSLRGEGLGDAEAITLAGSPHLARLRVLDLRYNRLTAAGAAALLNPASGYKLTELNLASNHVVDDLVPLLSSPGLSSLRRLDLSSNSIGARGAELLAGPSWLSGLESLNLANNTVPADAVERVAASPHLAGVKSLNLSHHRLPEKAARRLRERYGPRVVV